MFGMVIDVPYHPHNDGWLDTADRHALHVGRARLFQTARETQLLNLVKNWIKCFTKLIRGLIGVWLELEKPTHEDFHIKDLGLFVRLEPEPVDRRHLF
jgi:hypothetical protein